MSSSSPKPQSCPQILLDPSLRQIQDLPTSSHWQPPSAHGHSHFLLGTTRKPYPPSLPLTVYYQKSSWDDPFKGPCHFSNYVPMSPHLTWSESRSSNSSKTLSGPQQPSLPPALWPLQKRTPWASKLQQQRSFCWEYFPASGSQGLCPDPSSWLPFSPLSRVSPSVEDSLYPTINHKGSHTRFLVFSFTIWFSVFVYPKLPRPPPQLPHQNASSGIPEWHSAGDMYQNRSEDIWKHRLSSQSQVLLSPLFLYALPAYEISPNCSRIFVATAHELLSLLHFLTSYCCHTGHCQWLCLEVVTSMSFKFSPVFTWFYGVFQ